MQEMNITSAQYTLDKDGNNDGVEAIIDGIVMSVPLVVSNRHYDEIMRQVNAGTLTIQEAE